MGRRIAGLAGAVLGLTGCRSLLGFEDPSARVDDATIAMNDDAPIADAPPLPDASVCPALGSECAGPTTLRTCATVGQLPVDTPCGWGCVLDNAARCANVIPSGGAVLPSDLSGIAFAGLADLTVSTPVSINTTTGGISGLRPGGIGVINGVGFVLRDKIGVFTFRSLTVTSQVTFEGAYAVALVAHGELRVDGPVLAQGTCVGNAAGPGGVPGGLAGGDGGGLGGGGAGSGSLGNTSAGGGGGHGTDGGIGGEGVSVPGGVAGGAFGDPQITMLRGGGGGGGGPSGGGAYGGGGGGAVQLVSNTRISVAAAGWINAGGCGGKAGLGGGGGGGAGGTILLEAPEVSIVGTLAVNGGGGAGGGAGGQPGGNGSLGTNPAPGGASGDTQGRGDGGNGGARTLPAGGNGEDHVSAGGGGGGIGRIRINTRTGSVDVQAGAVMSPALGDPDSRATSGAATTDAP